MSGQKNYKRQRRTPLLFLTGRSPEVIFPLPWNKSMKHNSLWTIAHLLKSDVGWGARHHRAYSVCWQRRPLINKPVLWNRCPSTSSVWRGNSQNWLIRDCLLFRVQPFGICVSFPKSPRCFPSKQWCYLFFIQGNAKVRYGHLQNFEISQQWNCLSSPVTLTRVSTNTPSWSKSASSQYFFSQRCPHVVTLDTCTDLHWGLHSKAAHRLNLCTPY